MIVRLTAEGRALIEEVFPGQVQAIIAEFSALDADEQETLGRLCKQLGTHGVSRASRRVTKRATES